MPMTVVVTRDVAGRYRGFLASVMPEVGPGVFVAAEMTRGVRQRVWTVLAGWWDGLPGGSIMMLWRDDSAPGRLGIETLGLPPRRFSDLDGLLVVRRDHAV